MTEILSILLAMIALSSKRFLFCTQIVLSAITAFWIYRLFYPNMYIISYDKLDWPTIREWINNGNGLRAFSFTLICYLFFYWGLKLIMQKIVSKPLENSFSKQLALLSATERRMVNIVVVRRVRKVIKWMYRHGIIKPNSQTSSYTIHEHLAWVYSLFCWAIHIICCWFILGLNNSMSIYALIVIVFIVVLGLVISSAFVAPFFDMLSKTTKEEELSAQ